MLLPSDLDEECPAMQLTPRVNCPERTYLLGFSEQGAVMQGCYMRITSPILLSNAFRLSSLPYLAGRMARRGALHRAREVNPVCTLRVQAAGICRFFSQWAD